MFWTKRSKPVAPRAVSDAQLDAMIGMCSSACLIWRMGLTADEQKTSRAAAVLVGMFDAVAANAPLTLEQEISIYRSVLEGAETGPCPLKISADDLLLKMMMTSSYPELLPWSFYAVRKLSEMQRDRLDVSKTLGEIVDAVKKGTFDDPRPDLTEIAAKTVADAVMVCLHDLRRSVHVVNGAASIAAFA